MNKFPLIQTVTKRASILHEPIIKKSVFLITLLSILFVYSGCSGLPSLSDKEAAKLVSEYYLYYSDGEDVDVSILERGEYNDGCKCYPIKFHVNRSRASSGKKTFYFFEGSSGKFSIKKYASAVKK